MKRFSSLQITLLLCLLANLGLLFLVIALTARLRRSGQELARLRAHLESQLLLTRNLRADLDAAEARAVLKNLVIQGLREGIAQSGDSVDLQPVEPGGAPPDAPDVDDPSPTRDAFLRALAYHPAVRDVPILSEEEYEALRNRRRRIPRDISDAPLLQGDIESLLSDPEWNPSGRSLTTDERLELSVRAKEYLFYSRLSPSERLVDEILPLVSQMRERGQYIEFPLGEAPPTIDGVRISHAELSEDGKVQRLFVFRREDHPEMYHAQAVEMQRSLEAFVRAYEIINGSGE